MKILDVLTSPWAILPDKLLEIQAIYATHLRGEKIDINAVEARLGRPLANEPQGYTVHGGVAVLPLDGVFAKKMNMMTQISGGISMEIAAQDFRHAMADPAVHSIVLAIDSPGGSVDGTQALASTIRDARGQKQVVAYADGMMASAAYWVGSAADEIVIGADTAQIGSIGVVATHVDVSGAETQRGVRTTEIVAGKYKRIASQYGALTEDGRSAMQDQVDYIYSIFVADVARHRGVSEEKVLAQMADGRIFIGRQAEAAGLVDRVSTLDQLIADLNQRGGVRSNAFQNVTGEVMPITREQIAAEAPELIEALRAEGANAERARIQAIEAQAMPGHDALIAELKFDGKTTGPEAAVRVVAAEKASRASMLAAIRADAPAPVPFAPAPESAPAVADEASLPLEKRCAAKWEKNAELRTEFSSLEAFTAFERASVSGLAKVFARK